jgi:hypothetical protein
MTADERDLWLEDYCKEPWDKVIPYTIATSSYPLARAWGFEGNVNDLLPDFETGDKQQALEDKLLEMHKQFQKGKGVSGK